MLPAEFTCSSKPRNANLLDMDSDYLYHLNINIENVKKTGEIESAYGDVRFVCIGGTPSRMENLAKYLAGVLEIEANIEDLTHGSERYQMFKVGPVLCCSHGIGMPSTSIVLHELIKLLRYAKCVDPIFIRLGTCGGLGIPPGSVVVSRNVLNGGMTTDYEIYILGKKYFRPCKFDETVSIELSKCQEEEDKFKIYQGNTMSTDCFYEGQARLDGASCHYTPKEKMEFLNKLHKKYKVRNFEMETGILSSLCYHCGLKSAAVCVTLLNRLNGDQINISKDEYKDMENRPAIVVGRYIKKVLEEEKRKKEEEEMEKELEEQMNEMDENEAGPEGEMGDMENLEN